MGGVDFMKLKVLIGFTDTKEKIIRKKNDVFITNKERYEEMKNNFAKYGANINDYLEEVKASEK